MRFSLFLIFCFLSSCLFACGSGAGGGESRGSTSGGTMPGLRGANALSPNNPVVPGDLDATNLIPPDAITVSVPVPQRGARSEVMFEGNIGFNGTATLLVDITNTQSMGSGALSLQSVVFYHSGYFTRSFAMANGMTLVSQNDMPIKTLAVIPTSSVNSLTYPTRGRDEPLIVTSYLQTIDFGGRIADNFTGRLVLKNDASLDRGLLKVNIFLEGPDARNLINHILESINIFMEIFLRVGISVDFVTIERPTISGILPNPSIARLHYEEASQSLSDRQDAVNIFIGSSITAVSDSRSILGVSGGLPGSYFPSGKSAVAIALDAHTGLDGNLLPARRRLLGETIAHETGHYLGLFHPVEIDLFRENSFHDQDPLGDTPTCVSLTECNSIGLTRNLMFPIPVDINTSQQNITPEQADVLNIQPLVQ